jgi:hypothetical protein
MTLAVKLSQSISMTDYRVIQINIFYSQLSATTTTLLHSPTTEGSSEDDPLFRLNLIGSSLFPAGHGCL